MQARPHDARVRVLPHITKLDDCFGDFLVRVICAAVQASDDCRAFVQSSSACQGRTEKMAVVKVAKV